jgi:hypothetical protein
MIKFILVLIIIYLIYLMEIKKTPIKKILNNFIKGNEKFSSKKRSILNIQQAINEINKNTGFKNIDKKYKQTFYRPGSITINLKNKIKCLINPLIYKLRNLTSEHIVYHNMDLIQQNSDSSNNNKYYIEFFVHNLTSFIEIKLTTEIIIFNDENIHYNYIKIAKGSNLYNSIKPISSNVYDMDKILNEIKKDGLVHGEYYTKLNQSRYESHSANDPIEKSNKRNPWYIFPEINSLESKGINGLPCRKIYNIWNDQGLQLTERSNKNCIGINSATKKRDIIGNYNPTVTKMGKNNKDLHSMFELSRGIPSNRQSINLGRIN